MTVALKSNLCRLVFNVWWGLTYSCNVLVLCFTVFVFCCAGVSVFHSLVMSHV